MKEDHNESWTPPWGGEVALGTGSSAQKPHVWAGISKYVMIGARFAESAVRAALPPTLSPVDAMTGGMVVFEAHRNLGIHSFDSFHMWIDVKGFDTHQGVPARYLVGGFSSAADNMLTRYHFKLRDGWARQGRETGLAVGEAGSDGLTRYRAAVRPTGRRRRATSYLHHYVGIDARQSPTVTPFMITNDFEEADPVSALVDLPDWDAARGLLPTELLWGARPRNGVFVEGPSFTGAPVWADRRRDALAAERLTAIFEQMRRGAVLVEDDQTVLLINAPARRTLGDGLLLTNGKLRANGGQQGKLEALIAAATSPLADDGYLGPVAIRRSDGKKPLLVQAIPMAASHQNTIELTPAGTPMAMILVTDIDLPAVTSTSGLELLGLAPHEARIAAAVGSGLSSQQAAMRLGLTSSTVRSALTLIYDKLAINRQSQLALIVARLEVAP